MEEKKSRGTLVKLLLVVLIVVVVLLFSIDNSENVRVGLVFSETQIPLTALMIGNLLLGLLTGLVFLAMNSLKNRKLIKKKDKEIAALEERLEKLHDKIDELNEAKS
ncbi:DUF1049 domain-containing protein [bacterium]|nr:DUF1049 domain-containing protein [bacterium]